VPFFLKVVKVNVFGGKSIGKVMKSNEIFRLAEIGFWLSVVKAGIYTLNATNKTVNRFISYYFLI